MLNPLSDRSGWLYRFLVATALSIGSASAGAELKISGSDTLEPFMQDALSQFARAGANDVPVSVSFKGTSAGLRDLCEGRAGIAPASVRIDPDSIKRCEANRVNYLELPIAFDAVVVIAHPSRSGLGELDMSELKAIFHPEQAGKTVRWSQVRANQPDLALTVVSLDPKSGTNAFFGAKVHGLRGFVRHDAKATTDHAAVIKMVAADPGAIGFVSMGGLSESRAAVWKVPLNFGKGPVVPSRESVLNGGYDPLSRLMYVYVSKAALADKDGHTQQFMVWLMDRASKLASYEGFVPLIDTNYQDNLRKLSAR
jgi:phosphate transport system substrate-binding protein